MALREGLIDVRPLRGSRPFRDLWAGSSLASIGRQIAVVAVLQQVWELTRSPLWTGAIGLATGVPMLVLGLVGGSLADAVDRRSLVRAATGGQTLAALGLMAQAAAGTRSVTLLLALVAAESGCAALGAPARRTFPVRLLPSDQVAAGLALQNVAFQASMLIGPAVAGLVLARWGHPAAYAVQALATAASLVAVLRLPAMPARRAGDRRPAGRGRRGPPPGGWQIILRHPILWGSFCVDLAATVPAMPVALFPMVNELRFGGDPRTLGCSCPRSRSAGSAPACSRGRSRGFAAAPWPNSSRPRPGAWPSPPSAWRGLSGSRCPAWRRPARPTPWP